MEIENLIERLKNAGGMDAYYNDSYNGLYHQAADAITELRAELEKVKAELVQEREDFVDCVCSGVLNYAPYCRNRKPDCVDERGWCVQSMCHGFSRNKED